MSALTGFFQYKSYKAEKKAAAFQQQAFELQQKQVNLENARKKRDAVREARIAFGTAQNTAANQGVSGSSSSLGGLSSITSQAADNVSFLDQYGFYSDQATKLLGRAQKAKSSAAGYAAFGQFLSNAESTAAKIFGG